MTTSYPLASGTVATTIATGLLVSMDLYVTDLTAALLSFNRIEVWRSRLGEGGPYEELTGLALEAATLLSGVDGPSLLDGLELELRMQERYDVTIVFAGVDPFDLADTAAAITAQGDGYVTGSVDGLRVRLTTVTTGASAALRVLGGEAAGALAFSTEEPDSVDFGRDLRISLVVGQEVYNFVDQNGSADYYYKTRYSHTLTSAVSEFSLPFPGRTSRVLPVSQLIRGYVDLIDGQGRPIASRGVFVGSKSVYQVSSGQHVIGGTEWRQTDVNGHYNATLVRGSRVLVAIAGTNIVRELTVPTDPALESFNLLDVTYGSDDAWAVQRPDIDFAVRRS